MADDLTPQQLKKLARFAKFIDNKELATIDEFNSLDEKLETLDTKIDKGISELSQELKKKLDEELNYEIDPEDIRGEDGHTPTNDELVALIEPLIPEPIAGEKGDTVFVEKVIERTETIKEVPIVTENRVVVEVAKYEDPEQIVEKVNTSKILIEPTQVRGFLDLKMNLSNSPKVYTGTSETRVKELIKANTSTGGVTSFNGRTGVVVPVVNDYSALLNIYSVLQTFSAGMKSGFVFPSANSITAFQIRKADGTTNILNVDSTNSRIGIGTAAPAATLDVNGTTIIRNKFTVIKNGGAASPNTDSNAVFVMDSGSNATNMWQNIPTAFNGGTNGTFGFTVEGSYKSGVVYSTIGGGYIALTNDAANDEPLTGVLVDAVGNVSINGISPGTSVFNINGLPTDPTGLSAGDVWNNSGALSII